MLRDNDPAVFTVVCYTRWSKKHTVSNVAYKISIIIDDNDPFIERINYVQQLIRTCFHINRGNFS